jgi:superfamily II RNA helicase
VGFAPAAMDPEASLYAHLPPGDEATPDRILDAFLSWVAAQGLSLYPHQEEAVLAVMQGKHVILHTPTGSGKSLVATAVHFKAVAEGRRSFYTSPIKALSSEKFFALCRELGPDNVGLMTGDASVNREAPVICCTAEVLANVALAEGEGADVDYVVMDEFHYFSDRDRGVAWQVPLLTLPQARFVLMSATLGDVTSFVELIERQTGTEVVVVRSVERPVPLSFEYQDLPLHEAVQKLVNEGRSPVYVVEFTQRGVAEIAQSLLSQDFASTEEKQRLKQALVGESFKSPNGKDMQKLLRHGIGIHHAGLLPRYRLLVEKLAQQGLLKIICGTDTLGVGVNVPIRTVLFTKLCKYDGDKVRILSARDFHQIAGRAGRKGFDDRGYVVSLAPEHVVENLRLEAKAQRDPSKKKKIVRKKPPEWGYVHWDKAVFEKLVSSTPEPLVSRFQVSYGMLLSVLSRPEGACNAMKRLVKDSLENPKQKRNHGKHALVLLRALLNAGVVEFRSFDEGGGVRVNTELQRDFSLFHALGLYLVDAVERLDREAPSYALDVIGMVEAIVEDPEVVLRRQVDQAKTQKLAEMKAAGVEYDERMAELEKIEHPKPNLEFLEASFEAFVKDHPWVSRDSLHPKSVAREMIENFYSFSGYVKDYGLARSEGVLLRYLTEVYKTLVQSVPELARTEELSEAIAQLGSIVRTVDSSLLDEWERIRDPRGDGESVEEKGEEPAAPRLERRVLIALTRNLLFAFVRAVARRDFESALDLVEPGILEPSALELERAFSPLFRSGETIQLDARARSPEHTQIEPSADYLNVTQSILVDDEVSEYLIRGRVDLERSELERRAVFLLDSVGTLEP